MNDTEWPLLMEEALRGYLSRRCKRAYAHDMRNGLQGIYGGVDAMARAARSNKPGAVSLEQVAKFVQQAITNHEHGLDHVLESIAPEANAMAPVVVGQLFTDLVRFLTTDAARNGVRFKIDIAGTLVVHTVPAQLRLICLALLADAIDSLPAGGDVRVTGHTSDARLQIELADTRTVAPSNSWIVSAIDSVVGQLSGQIARQQTAQTGYQVRVEFPSQP